jgi:hypothetical protein
LSARFAFWAHAGSKGGTALTPTACSESVITSPSLSPLLAAPTSSESLRSSSLTSQNGSPPIA